MKERFKKALEKPWAAYTFAACVAVLLFVALTHFSIIKNGVNSVMDLLSPVITGLVVAYLFNPLSDFFERTMFKKIKKESTRHVSGVAMTIVCVVLLLAVLLVALIPSLVESISKFIRNWGVYTLKIEEVMQKLIAFFASHNIKIDLTNLQNTLHNSMDSLITFVKGNYKTILTTLGSVGKGVGNFAVGILFGFCFLIAKKGLLNVLGKARSAISPQADIEKRNALWKRCHEIFLRYIGSTLLDALIIGVSTLIFMLIAGMPYAPLIAVVVGITNIIPTFGPLIGNLIGVFFIVLESPVKALIFFIFVCVLQSVDGMLIKPKLFKGSLGIPAVWTLVLIILGGKVAGIAGILLAVPFAAILVILYQQTIVPRLERRKQAINTPPNEGEPDAAGQEGTAPE